MVGEIELGPHLMINFFGCQKAKLQDVSLVYNILESFPEKYGLGKSELPNVFRYQGGEEEWGVSGVTLNNGSHMSIHTFPSKEQVVVNIFSNKELKVEQACQELRQTFAATHQEISQDEVITKEGIIAFEPQMATVRPRIYH